VQTSDGVEVGRRPLRRPPPRRLPCRLPRQPMDPLGYEWRTIYSALQRDSIPDSYRELRCAAVRQGFQPMRQMKIQHKLLYNRKPTLDSDHKIRMPGVQGRKVRSSPQVVKVIMEGMVWVRMYE